MSEPDTEQQPQPEQAQQPEPVQEEPMADDSRAAELENELRRLRADAVAGVKTRLRVEPPHVSFTHGGVTVVSEFTDVPERAVPALTEAAHHAGVTLTREG